MDGVSHLPRIEGAKKELSHKGSGLFAAIDLGTNNCRLLMGVPTPDGFRVTDSFSRIVRLGEGLDATGLLSDVAMDRAIDALRACATRMDRRPVRAIRAVATEACRQAANGPAFLNRVRAETGIPIGMISTREEAELALESCAPLLRGPARRALVFDIGGGSTELAWVRLQDGVPPGLIGYASLPLGVVTLSERYGAAAFTPEGFEAMVAHVAARLSAFEQVHCIGHELRAGGVWALGTSGTVTTLAGIAMNLKRYRRPLVDGTILTATAAEQALADVTAMGAAGLAAHPCVGPDRVPYVLPGCAVFEAIRRVWPLGDVIVADRGLREGLLLRMMRQAAGLGTVADAPRRAYAPNGTAVAEPA